MLTDVPLEEIWDYLPGYVEEGRVIPIVGEELLQVREGDAEIPLYQFVARKLVERLAIPTDQLAGDPSLNDVVCHYLSHGGRRLDIYSKIPAILNNAKFEPPAALKRLAQIPHFKLFVSVTFDRLLAQAIDDVRFGGQHQTHELAYSPTKSLQDLPCEMHELRGENPVVFHLFGKASPSPDYVITEEDALEFLYRMQSRDSRPSLLFDELKNNHLLFVGCNLSDWLVRFFMRVAKDRKLSLDRDEREVFIGRNANRDKNLVLFLNIFSPGTKLVSTSAIDFVEELASRVGSASAPADAPAASAPRHDRASGTGMREGAIFISYAREDTDSATRLYKFLIDAGLDVWLDQEEFKGGEKFEQTIRQNIDQCSYFIPIISTQALNRHSGFFWAEWRWAQERTQKLADFVEFIIPVVVDETSEYSPRAPEGFRKAHWNRLPDGTSSAKFTQRMKDLVGEYKERMKN